MPGSGGSQHRPVTVPTGSQLIQRVSNLETILGLQGGGVLPSQQLVFQGVESYNMQTLSTTSATYAPISGAPAVTLTIGPSGNCIINYSCGIISGTANQIAACSLAVDGVLISGISFLYLKNPAAGSVVTTFGATYSYSALSSVPATTLIPRKLSAGVHTFTMWYEVSTGTGQFNTNYLRVTPV